MSEIAPPTFRSGPRQKNVSPDPTWLVALGASLLLVVVLTWMGGETMNKVAAVLGLFGSVLLLGMARSKEVRLKSTGRFSDWSISSTTITTAVFASTWALGVLNVFFVAKEWSRR